MRATGPASLIAVAAGVLTVAYPSAGTERRPQPTGRATVVRAYEVWLPGGGGDVTRHDQQCGWATGPFTVLGSDTAPAAGAEIARQIEAADVAVIAQRAFATAAAALPGPPVTLCLYAAELVGGLPFLGGVGGVSLGGGRIKIFLHPTVDRFARVPYTVAHEYHHEVLRLDGWPGTPEHIVVSEGKADRFATTLHPALRPPHTAALSEAELGVVWAAFQRSRTAADADFRTAFMIGRPGGLPRWAGYRLGFQIVDRYVSSRRLGVAEWTRVPAREMLDEFSAYLQNRR